MYKLRFEAEEDGRTRVLVKLAKQVSLLLRTVSGQRKSSFSGVQLCFLGHYYFCLWLFGRPVTDTEAVPSSETPGAQASVGCFTDPGRSFDFHVSSAVRLSVCQVGVRAYVVPLRVCTASVSRSCVISCKFACVW